MSVELHRRWGRAIKVARETKGWSQSALAHRLAVRPSSVSRWEAGSCAPSDENKLRIAEVLDIEVGDLFPLIALRSARDDH
ncbi:MAG TPA: helix-turn-helix transcriptional regulator [Acidimicrobiales bacterium]|jgi:ribosome-binding protein aMBF1 (putative translation factor)|nr:helix-turn-helix transcriptional regulator [Acidimicrobiales bacterium]